MGIANLRSLDREKYQRAVNKIVKDFNKSLRSDWLWSGRFVVSQREAYFMPFEDKSGAEFKVILCCTDTKTGRETTKEFTNFNIDWQLGWWLNKCITEIFDVWNEEPGPYEQARAAGRKPDGEE